MKIDYDMLRGDGFGYLILTSENLDEYNQLEEIWLHTEFGDQIELNARERQLIIKVHYVHEQC